MGGFPFLYIPSSICYLFNDGHFDPREVIPHCSCLICLSLVISGEKAMAAHSSTLAWKIPGTGEPGGLPSRGSHRVGHDRSDLAAAATIVSGVEYFFRHLLAIGFLMDLLISFSRYYFRGVGH